MDKLPSYIEDIIANEFQTSIQSCNVPSNGRIGEIYILKLDNKPLQVVCKLGGPSIRTGDIVEPQVIQLVQSIADIPVPEVYATGEFGGKTRLGKHYAIYEFVDGNVPSPFNLLNQNIRRQVVFEIGCILGKLHKSRQFTRIGGLHCSESNKIYINDPNGINFPKQGRRLVGYHPRLRNHDWEPVLSHGDLFPENLLINDDGSICALLDWGNAHITTAGYALARAEMRFIDWFQFSSRESVCLRKILRDGYKQYRSFPPDYPSFNNFYKSVWLAQSADRVVRNLSSHRGRQQMKRHFYNLLPK